MIDCTHIDIFKLIKKHKDFFETKASEFFYDNIVPVYKANNNKKLNLQYGRDNELWLATKDNLIIKQTTPFLIPEYIFDDYSYRASSLGERIDIVALIPNFIGGGEFYQQAFMYFLSTNLDLFAKYFNVRDIKGWFFHSGINDLKKKQWIQIAPLNELNAFCKRPYNFDMPDFTNYTRPWYKIAKEGGLNNEEKEYADQICDMLKVGSIYELISDGYTQYQSGIKPQDLGLPKSLNNAMDFAIWKNKISKIKITGANINEIMYKADYGSRWAYKGHMVEHIWKEYPNVAKRKYFSTI